MVFQPGFQQFGGLPGRAYLQIQFSQVDDMANVIRFCLYRVSYFQQGGPVLALVCVGFSPCNMGRCFVGCALIVAASQNR